MAYATAPRPWTTEEFAEWEELQEGRFELVDDVVTAMSGGTVDHSRVATNILVALRAALRAADKPCDVWTSDMKLMAHAVVAYPDVTVTCGPRSGAATRLHDPVLIVEVLSRSTAARDRTAKWDGYRAVRNLKHYVLASTDFQRLDVFTREGETDDWRLSGYGPGRRAALTALGIDLYVDTAYEGSDVPSQLPHQALDK